MIIDDQSIVICHDDHEVCPAETSATETVSGGKPRGGKGKRTPVVREVADEDRPAGGGPRELAPGDLGGHLHVRPVLLDVPVDDRLLMSYPP